jgi:SanA protein
MRLPGFIRRHPRASAATALVAVLGAGSVLAANALVVLTSNGDTTSHDPLRLPHAQAALVLGAQVQPDGRMSAMLADRVNQAIALWRAGKVDRVLVSGDHRSFKYDEPGIMREALLRAGVPPEAIFTDHAGFNTWASMVRARKVFDVSSVIVVTQGFHMARALYLARAAGLHANGLDADLRGYGKQGTKSDVREVFARVKAVGSALTHQHVLLGPKLPITGDGRTSWGPAAPPGTPPSGAPAG